MRPSNAMTAQVASLFFSFSGGRWQIVVDFTVRSYHALIFIFFCALRIPLELETVGNQENVVPQLTIFCANGFCTNRIYTY